MNLCFECHVPLGVETVFGFHESPSNLANLLRGWPGFRLLRHADHVRVGAEVWFEQTVAGFVPVVMGFRHTLYEPPRRFGEEMIRGPFRRFQHVHEFEPAPEGAGTIVRDRLDVRLPWYLGGDAAVRLFFVPTMKRFFAFRHAALQRLAAEGRLAG